MVSPEDLKVSDPTSPGRSSLNEISPMVDPLKTPVKPRSKTISARTDSKSFDVFLSGIPKVQSLNEAKRLRNDVDREMRILKNSSLLSGRTVPDEQRRREEAHLKRLDRARKRIDKRIEKLQGKSSAVSPVSHVYPSVFDASCRLNSRSISRMSGLQQPMNPLFAKSSKTPRRSTCSRSI